MFSVEKNLIKNKKNSSVINIRISIPIKTQLNQIHKTNIQLIKNDEKDQEAIVEKIINNHRKNNSVVLNLFTGFGKTIVGLYLASYFKRTLVIISYNVLYNQWMDKIKEYNIDYVDVVKVITELNKNTIEINKEYGMIIIDECHHEFKRVSKLIKRYEIEQLIGLSATPLEIEETKTVFKDVISIPLQPRSYTVQPVKLYFDCITFKKNKQGKRDYNVAMSEMYNNKDRMNAISNFINERLYLKSLILVRNIVTIEYLKNNIKTTDLSTFYGSMSELNLENNIVIGTYPKMGVGLDTKCFNALYLLDNKKNIIQAEGRCRNDDLIIFDLIDSDGIFKNHYYLHKKFYRERKVKILDYIYLRE